MIVIIFSYLSHWFENNSLALKARPKYNYDNLELLSRKSVMYLPLKLLDLGELFCTKTFKYINIKCRGEPEQLYKNSINILKLNFTESKKISIILLTPLTYNLKRFGEGCTKLLNFFYFQ